ncbi:catecholate siderophore receptor [Granulicella aggregans]|uniref:Catecholate siderophore receptor n=1 Tax=Granulicella aggregans TaxID=474949 RepID=A0A7W8E5N5_9BACT|nr:TonB-dependent receptor [Granulicella aggregans]MBB5058370.1 catecholate siderophore receptor [Granulicella aggregans]
MQEILNTRKSPWLALGTLAAYTVMGAGRPAMASTPNEDGLAAGEPPATTKPVRQFNIPAGPLDGAIATYEALTGLTISTSLPGKTLAPFDSNGVSGLYTNEEALKLILAGTGLEATAGVNARSLVIGIRQHADSVDVSAGLPDALAMTKFTEPLLDTPQTVVAVPKFVLEDEGNTTLRDALRNVPGISMAAGESGAQGDNLTIRGFTARNDIFLDGIRDFGSYYRDSFDYEQIEVLEGPAGVQFGRGSTGGVINQESKVPQAQDFVKVGAVFGTDLTRRITADINKPLPDLGDGTAFRMNVVATEGGVAGRPYAENRHYGVAPSITFGMNSKTRYTVSYFHFTESDTPDYGLPWFFSKVAPTSRHNYFGFPDQNYLRTSDDILTGKVDHDFGQNVALHSIARWANYPRQAQITEPQICSNAAFSVPVGGVIAAKYFPTSSINSKQHCSYTPASDPATIAVNRNQLQIKSVEGDLWDQTELTARFKVLGIGNNFAGGAEGGREVSNPIRTSYTLNSVNSVPSTSLLHPNPHDSFGGTGYISTIVHTTSKSAGVYFVDTIHLGRLFEASGGVRWDYFDTNFNSYQPVAPPTGGAVSAAIPPQEQVVTQPTYRAAFVYKPTQHGSVYFDYGTSFNPSAESLSLSVATKLLPPEENETYEVGAKYSLLHDKLMLDGAWFHTTKDNARETDPTNSNNIVLAGNQLVKGAQMSMVGKLPQGTDVILGYAYLDSAVTYSKLFPASIGYPLANVPRQTFNFFVTHRLPGRLNAGFGGNSLSARTASSTVPYVPTGYSANADGTYTVTSVAMKAVPSYWVFNAMLRRPLTDRLDLQANVYNLTNKFYIDQPHPSHLIPGAGLNAQVGVNFKF